MIFPILSILYTFLFDKSAEGFLKLSLSTFLYKYGKFFGFFLIWNDKLQQM